MFQLNRYISARPIFLMIYSKADTLFAPQDDELINHVRHCYNSNVLLASITTFRRVRSMKASVGLLV